MDYSNKDPLLDEISSQYSIDNSAKQRISVLEKIQANLEYVHSHNAGYFLELFVTPILVKELNTTPIQFEKSDEQTCRMLSIKILSMLPCNNSFLEYAKLMLDTAFEVVNNDNEVNGLFAFRLITEIHKSYRRQMDSTVSDFMKLVLKLYKDFPKIVDQRFEEENEKSKSKTLDKKRKSSKDKSLNFKTPSFDSKNINTEGSISIKAIDSFKLLAEFPVVIVMLNQNYNILSNPVLNELLGLIVNVICISVSEEFYVSQHELYQDFVVVQVKSFSLLSFVAFVQKNFNFSKLSQEHQKAIPLATIQILHSAIYCSAANRRELLLAFQNIFETEFRFTFLPHLDHLIDEDLWTGKAYSARKQLRTLAYRTISSLVQPLRMGLTSYQIGLMIQLYSRNAHDNTLPVTMQLFLFRHLLQLLEPLVQSVSKDRQFEGQVRRLLDRIGDSFVRKTEETEILIQKLNSNDITEAEISTVIFGAASSSYSGKSINNYDPMEWRSMESMKEDAIFQVRALMYTLILGFRTLVYWIGRFEISKIEAQAAADNSSGGRRTVKASDPPLSADSSSNKNSGNPKVNFVPGSTSQSFLTNSNILNSGKNGPYATPTLNNDEVQFMSRFLKSTLNCFVIYKSSLYPVSDGTVKEMVEHLASIFTLIDLRSFSIIISKHLNLIYELMVENSTIQVFAQHLLAGPNVTRPFSELLLSFLIGKLPVFRKPNEKRQITTIVNLFRLIFYTMSLFVDNHGILAIHLNEIVMSAVVALSEIPNSMDHLKLVKVLFRYIGGGKWKLLYASMLPLLPNLLISMNRTLRHTKNEELKEILVELSLTVPVRLSSLLPYLHYLLLPLAIALQSKNEDLVLQGLRTLDLFVDNLTRDFFDPIVSNYNSEIMMSLWCLARLPSVSDDMTNIDTLVGDNLDWKTQEEKGVNKGLEPEEENAGANKTRTNKNSSRQNLSFLAMKLLGKLGSRSRSFLSTVQIYSHTRIENEFNQLKIAVPVSNEGYPVYINFSKVLDIINRNSINIKSLRDDSVRALFSLIQSCFVAILGFKDLDSLLSNKDSTDFFSSSKPISSILEYDNNPSNNYTVLLLENLMKLSMNEVIKKDFEPFMEFIRRQFALLCIKMCFQFDDSSEMEVEDGFGDIISGSDTSQKTMIIDPRVIMEALFKLMCNSDTTLAAIGKNQLDLFIQMVFSFCDSKKSGSNLSIWNYLFEKACHACYSSDIVEKKVGLFCLKFFINVFPCDWIKKRKVKLINVLLSIIGDDIIPMFVDDDVAFACRKLVTVCFEEKSLKNATPKKGKDTPKKRKQIRSKTSITSEEEKEFLNELVITLCSHVEISRKIAMECLELYSKLKGITMVDVVKPWIDVIMEEKLNESLLHCTIEEQLSAVVSFVFIFQLIPDDIVFTDNILEFLEDVIKIGSADTSSMNISQSKIVELRIQCLKLLSVTFYCPAFISNDKFSIIRNDAIKLLIQCVGIPLPKIQNSAKNGLSLVLLKQRLPKELLEKVLRPVLRSLADYRKLSLELLRTLRSLLELISQQFNTSLGQKLIEHLLCWLKPFDPNNRNPDNQHPIALWPGGRHLVIAAEILEVFCLLPDGADVFIWDLTRLVIELESVLPTDQKSPFRSPILKYYARFPKATVDYFLHNFCVLDHIQLFTSLLRDNDKSLCEPIFKELMARPEYLVKNAFQVTEIRKNLPSLPASLMSNPTFLSVRGNAQDVKYFLENKATRVPSSGEKGDFLHKGLQLVHLISENYPGWLATCTVLEKEIVEMWKLPNRDQLLTKEELLSVEFLYQNKLILECLISIFRARPAEKIIDSLFDLVSSMGFGTNSYRSSVSYSFVQEFYQEWIENCSMENAKTVLEYFLKWHGNTGTGRVNPSIVQIQYSIYWIIIPLIENLAKRKDVNIDNLLNGPIINSYCTYLFSFVPSRLFSPKRNNNNSKEIMFNEILAVHYLELAYCFTKNISTLTQEYAELLMKFSYAHIHATDPQIVHCAYLLMCSILQKFETNSKLLLQVYVALLKSHQPTSKIVVNKALDILAPILSEKLPHVNNELSRWIQWTRRILIDESNSLQQVIHVWQLIVRFPMLFYPGYSQFLQLLIGSLSKMALSGSSPFENRKLAALLVEVLIVWEKKARSENSNKKTLESDSLVVEVVSHFLIRVATSTPADGSRESIRLPNKCVELFSETISLWPEVEIRFDVIRTLFAYPVQYPLNAQVALDLIIRIMNEPVTGLKFLSSHPKLAQELAPCIACPLPRINSACLILITKILNLIPMDTRNPIYAAVIANFLQLVANILGSIEKLNFSITDTTHSVYGVISILMIFSDREPKLLDPYMSLLVALAERLSLGVVDELVLASRNVAEDNVVVALLPEPLSPEPKNFAKYKSPAFVGTLSTNNVKNIGETKSSFNSPINCLEYVLELISLRILYNSVHRQDYMDLLMFLLDNGNISIKQRIHKIIRKYIEENSELLTSLEKANFIAKILNNSTGNEEEITATLNSAYKVLQEPLPLDYKTAQYVSTMMRRILYMGSRYHTSDISLKFQKLLFKSIPEKIDDRLLFVLDQEKWSDYGISSFILPAFKSLFSLIDVQNCELVNRFSFRNFKLPDISLPFKSDKKGKSNNEDLISHRSYLMELSTLTVRESFVEPLLLLSQSDIDIAKTLWLEIIPQVWSYLPSKIRKSCIQGIIRLLSSPATKTTENTIVHEIIISTASSCDLFNQIPIEVFYYSAVKHGLWFEVYELFEYNLNKTLESGKENKEIKTYIAKILKTLSEEDMLRGHQSIFSKNKETKASLAYDAYMRFNNAQGTLMHLMNSNEAMKILEKDNDYFEVYVWEDEWIKQTKRLQQWDALGEFAHVMNHAELSMATSWRKGDWDTLSKLLNTTEQEESGLQASLYASYIATMQIDSKISKKQYGGNLALQHATNMLNNAKKIAAKEWKALPIVNIAAHNRLLQVFQYLVEVEESFAILATLNSSASNFQGNSVVDNGNSKDKSINFVGLRNILLAWRERIPFKSDDFTVWNELFQLRLHIFNALNTVPELANTYLGYHEIAWTINRLAYVARKQGLIEISLRSLHRIYKLPNIEIMDAFFKLREQVKCYLKLKPIETTHLAGIDVIHNTNMNFFSLSHKSEFWVLKGISLHKLKRLNDAHAAFSTALHIYDGYGSGWVAWGDLCDDLYTNHEDSRGDAAWGRSIVTCYMQGIRFNSSKARRLMSRILDLMVLNDNDWDEKLMGPIEVIRKAFLQCQDGLPYWLWIQWMPQMLQSLHRSEAPYFRSILSKLASLYPQALYLPLRVALLNAALLGNVVTEVRSLLNSTEKDPFQELLKELINSNTPNSEVQKGKKPALSYLLEIFSIFKVTHSKLTSEIEKILSSLEQISVPNEDIRRIGELELVMNSILNCDSSSSSTILAQVEELIFDITEIPKGSKSSMKDMYSIVSSSYKKLLKKLPKKLKLEEQSKYLATKNFSDVVLPGQYLKSINTEPTPSRHFRLARFGNELSLTHKTKGSWGYKVDFIATNGVCYPYLIQFSENGELSRVLNPSLEDDMEVDIQSILSNLVNVDIVSRKKNDQISTLLRNSYEFQAKQSVFELFDATNVILQKSVNATRNKVDIYRPICVRLSPMISLWLDRVKFQQIDFHTKLVDHKNKEFLSLSEIDDSYNGVASALDYLEQKAIGKNFSFSNKYSLNRFVSQSIPDPGERYKFRKQFSSYYAPIALFTYILGSDLGVSAHPDNIYISKSSGCSYSFGLLPNLSAKKLDIQQQVDTLPFRLTRSIEMLSSPSGISGIFKVHFTLIADILSNPKYHLGFYIKYMLANLLHAEKLFTFVDSGTSVNERLDNVLSFINSQLVFISKELSSKDDYLSVGKKRMLETSGDHEPIDSNTDVLINRAKSSTLIEKMKGDWRPWL